MSRGRRRDQQYREQRSLFAPCSHPMAGVSGAVIDHGKLSRDDAYVNSLPEHEAQRRKVLAVIASSGAAGLTREEIAKRGKVKLSSVCGRVDDLKKTGAVIVTGRKRPTDSGSRASVVVCREFASDSDLVQYGFGRSENNEKGTRVVNKNVCELPDAITCPVTPVDQHGDPLIAGRFYIVAGRRVKISEDPETGDLYYGERGKDRPVAVNMSDPNDKWERV